MSRNRNRGAEQSEPPLAETSVETSAAPPDVQVSTTAPPSEAPPAPPLDIPAKILVELSTGDGDLIYLQSRQGAYLWVIGPTPKDNIAVARCQDFRVVDLPATAPDGARQGLAKRRRVVCDAKPIAKDWQRALETLGQPWHLRVFEFEARVAE